MKKVGVLVVGVGDMGLSHARARQRPRHDATHRVEEVINSLRIVLAAAESVRTSEVIVL